MKLTDDDVTLFRRAYKEAYGEDMPMDEARTWALRLVRLYRILLSPTPSETADCLAKSVERARLEASALPAQIERPNSLPHSS